MSDRDFQLLKWRYYLLSFLGGLHFFSAVLLPFFTDWGGYNIAIAQSLQSWFNGWSAFLEVPTGIVADRWGRKYSVALGFFSIVVATLIYGMSRLLAWFVVGEWFFALGVALNSGSDRALIYDHLLLNNKTKDSTHIFNYGHAFHLAGIAVAGPIGGLMATIWGINVPMLATSIPALFACLVALTIPEPPPLSEDKHRLSPFKLFTQSLDDIRRHPQLRQIIANSLFVSVAGYMTIWYYQPQMQQLNMPLVFFGWAHGFLVLCEIFFLLFHEKLSKFFGGTTRYLTVTTLLIAISFILASLWRHPLTLILFLFFGGGVGLTRIEAMQSYINRYIDSNNRATALSTIAFFRRFTITAVNPIAGFIASTSLPLVLLVFGLFTCFSLFFSLKNGEVDSH